MFGQCLSCLSPFAGIGDATRGILFFMKDVFCVGRLIAPGRDGVDYGSSRMES